MHKTDSNPRPHDHHFNMVPLSQRLQRPKSPQILAIYALTLLQSKGFMHAPLTSKLCAEVWKTGYECSLNPGNENSKLEMETAKFPAKIDFNLHWKSSSLQTETSGLGPDCLFSFLNSTQPTGWIF